MARRMPGAVLISVFVLVIVVIRKVLAFFKFSISCAFSVFCNCYVIFVGIVFFFCGLCNLLDNVYF